MTKKVLYFDIESHSASKLWDMEAEEFFRLGQYAWNDEDVVITTSRQELIDQIESADLVIGHNIVNFDLTALYGKDSIRPLELAMEGRVLDTMVLANLVYPSRYIFKMRPGDNGKQRTVTDGLKPEKAKMWLSLDNLCFQLGLDGKVGDLRGMAHEAAKAAGITGSKSELIAEGFGLIPLDDPTFLTYSEQDIIAVRALAKTLRGMVRRSGVSWDYIWREMKIVSIDAQNTRNGILVDLDEARARVNELAQERDEIMSLLVEKYDFPTEGKSPWASAAGKDAIFKILADNGITEETTPDWKRTATGNLSLGGEEIIRLTEGTEIEKVGQAIAALKGQRSLAQLTLDSTHADGRVHPDITRFQRSGRTSVSNPGLTVWTSRGPGAIEKRYYIADPGTKLVGMDLSNADQRIVAAYSGDTEYAKRFQPDPITGEEPDGHEINARIAVGDEVYDSDPKHYRNLFKACVAEGTLVLTDKGEVPIEQVTTEMKVWDGVEFVTHEGMVYSGVKEVIEYDGLIATPDHYVFTQERLEVPFGVAAADGLHLEVSGSCGHPVRASGDYLRDDQGSTTPRASLQVVRAGEVPELWPVRLDELGQPIHREGEGRVPTVLPEEPEAERTGVVDQATVSGSTTLREPSEPGIRDVRGARSDVRVGHDSGSSGMDHGECQAARPEPATRPDRQRQGVRAGEHTDGHEHGERPEQTEHGVSGWVPAGGVAVREERSSTTTEAGDDSRGDHRGRPEDRAGTTGEVARDRRTARVYDIVNAGPRHRFTANGRLVANCSHGWAYGGRAKTLAAQTGVDLEITTRFVKEMDAAFPMLTAWKEDVIEEGRYGTVMNDWGRRMVVDRDRSFTQSPALYGQSGTRELICDALIRIAEYDIEMIRWLRFQIHDELIWAIPEDDLWWAIDEIRELTEATFKPKTGGLAIHFPVGCSEPSDNWFEAGDH